MKIPKLKKNSRRREYDSHTEEEHAKVVKAYLFDGLSHREVDKKILLMDDTYTRGYQSMGILHYLGLNGPFKGIFSGMTVNAAIKELKDQNDPTYNDIIAILSGREINEQTCKNDISIETTKVFEVGTEGQKKYYYTTRYERNPKLRKQAIQIHGTTCMVCGFNFEDKYGSYGKDYIEVHHVKPLSKSQENIEVNPETDMVVVCANCHRMIHRKKNAILSIQELKELL